MMQTGSRRRARRRFWSRRSAARTSRLSSRSRFLSRTCAESFPLLDSSSLLLSSQPNLDPLSPPRLLLASLLAFPVISGVFSRRHLCSPDRYAAPATRRRLTHLQTLNGLVLCARGTWSVHGMESEKAPRVPRSLACRLR